MNNIHLPQMAPIRLVFLHLLLLLLVTASIADESNNNNNKRPGLFSQMNNWLAKLRGNRDQNNNSHTTNNNSDKDKEDKKDETTTLNPMQSPFAHALYPPMIAMAPPHGPPPPFAPITPAASSPFAPFSSHGPNGAMFAPIAAMAASHQFAAHHQPPPARLAMHPAAGGFGPFIPHAAPISLGPLSSNPFGSYSSPSHMIPMHNDFADSFGSSFSPYGTEQADPNESAFGDNGPSVPPHHHHHHGPVSPNDQMDSSQQHGGPTGYDDSYSKKK